MASLGLPRHESLSNYILFDLYNFLANKTINNKLFLINLISTTYTTEINVIDAHVDVGTNTTTWVLLMDSDLNSVYAV